MSSAPTVPPAPPVTLRSVLPHADLAPILKVVAGEAGLDRVVSHPRIQKSGLALVGHMRGIVPTRLQVLGETELSYLESLDVATRRARIDAFFGLRLTCVIVTRGADPGADLVEAANRYSAPLVVASPKSSRTINAIHTVLDRVLAPTVTEHGVLVEIFGLGTLLLGPSGIGKSECALFLLERGHRLVADDRVALTLLPSSKVIGAPLPLLRHHIEVRGLGVLNVRDLFGAAAVTDQATVELVVELCHWEDEAEYDRLGIDDTTHEIFGVAIPMLRVPVRAGRNMGVILEVAARNQLLKHSGRHGAREFARNLAQGLGLNIKTGDPEGET